MTGAPVGASAATIEVRGLHKRYGSVPALNGLTFSARPGHVTGFLGPNGAGKTTTLRVVLGLDAPSAGTALVGGRSYRDLVRPLHEVGALLDANAVHPGRSARRHLQSLARSNRIAPGRVEEVLELTGIGTVAERRVQGLSLGMRQRLGIAAALLGDPSVLLFDEPANGLDAEGVHWLRALLRALADEGRTVLVSSHLLGEMALTADQLVIIGRGRLLADTPTERFVASSTRADLLVRSPRTADLARLLVGLGARVRQDGADGLAVTGIDAARLADLAAAHAVPVHELVRRQASLEQAYLDLTEGSVEYRAGAAPDEAASER